MTDPDGSSELVSKKVMEAALIGQEHRLLQILKNYWFRTQFEEGDPRRRAAEEALLWRIAIALAPSPAAATGGGILAILGLLVAFHANSLLSRQNDAINQQTELLNRQTVLMESQNTLLTNQNQLVEGSRRSQTLVELSAVLDQVGACISDLVKNGQIRPEKGWALPQHIIARIVSLSQSMKPYRYAQYFPAIRDRDSGEFFTTAKWLPKFANWIATEFDAAGKLNDEPLSPERAQLLTALLGSGVNVNDIHAAGAVFDYADLRFANLSNAQLRNASLRYASLLLANVSDSDFCGVDLAYADLRGSRWKSCLLDEARCGGSRLQYARLDLCHCRGMYFYGFNEVCFNGVTATTHRMLFALPIVYVSGASAETPMVSLTQAKERNGEIEVWIENVTDWRMDGYDGWKHVLAARPASPEDYVWTNSEGQIVGQMEPEQITPEQVPSQESDP